MGDEWLTDVGDPPTCRRVVDRMGPATARSAQRGPASGAADGPIRDFWMRRKTEPKHGR
jgi:hypothetical protein